MNCESLVVAPEGQCPPFRLTRAAQGISPLIFAVPHAGRIYPKDMGHQRRLIDLRRLEDGLVDLLVEQSPRCGATLMAATIARTYIDLNRDVRELDRDFVTPPPGAVAVRSARVEAGLGLFPRYAEGLSIYGRSLSAEEVAARIASVHQPYHQGLRANLTEAQNRFGLAVLIDWHSMPRSSATAAAKPGARGADMVLGDRHGTACDPKLTGWMEGALTSLGYRVARNHPFAGGYVTETYGRPAQGVHALQIEINRAIYLDETKVTPNAGFQRLKADLNRLTADLARQTHIWASQAKPARDLA